MPLITIVTIAHRRKYIPIICGVMTDVGRFMMEIFYEYCVLSEIDCKLMALYVAPVTVRRRVDGNYMRCDVRTCENFCRFLLPADLPELESE